LSGPINGETFRLYVEKVLVPSLRPGDIVILDNLGSHKGRAVRQAIRAAGAKLSYLPLTLTLSAAALLPFGACLGL
jgi:putative transposase